jgi:hypothetical protein
LDINKIPTYRDLTSLYLDGMTKEEIVLLYKADSLQMDLMGRKRTTKKKINNFFNVINESKKTYIEQPKARDNRANLVFYINRRTKIPSVSIVKVLVALENQGWNLQESLDVYSLPLS